MPSLTRLDVLTVFLRILLWVMLVTVLGTLGFQVLIWYATRDTWMLSMRIQAYTGGLFEPRNPWESSATAFTSFVLLLLFSKVLASNSAGSRAAEPIVDLVGLKSLMIPCVGLTLFVPSLGAILVPFVSLLWSYRQGRDYGNLALLAFLSAYISPIASMSFGFIFAFGPALRDRWCASLANETNNQL